MKNKKKKSKKIRKNYDVLVPHARAYKGLHIERDEAEAMFNRFLSDGFSYHDISHQADLPVYASAEFLMDLLPWIIDAMLEKEGTNHFLVLPMMAAIDPMRSEEPEYQKRAQKVIELADKDFTQKICQFLEAIKDDPPSEEEDHQRVMIFWQNKLAEFI